MNVNFKAGRQLNIHFTFKSIDKCAPMWYYIIVPRGTEETRKDTAQTRKGFIMITAKEANIVTANVTSSIYTMEKFELYDYIRTNFDFTQLEPWLKDIGNYIADKASLGFHSTQIRIYNTNFNYTYKAFRNYDVSELDTYDSVLERKFGGHYSDLIVDIVANYIIKILKEHEYDLDYTRNGYWDYYCITINW